MCRKINRQNLKQNNKILLSWIILISCKNMRSFMEKIHLLERTIQSYIFTTTHVRDKSNFNLICIQLEL